MFNNKIDILKFRTNVQVQLSPLNKIKICLIEVEQLKKYMRDMVSYRHAILRDYDSGKVP